MKSVRKIILQILCIVAVANARADIRHAIANAQAGLAEALSTSFPRDRMHLRIEKRDIGILL